MEELSLTTPITVPAITHYRVAQVYLDWDSPQVAIALRGPTGESRSHTYSNAAATSLLRALNTANLTVKSLHRRILERLVADGVLAGTPTGTPD